MPVRDQTSPADPSSVDVRRILLVDDEPSITLLFGRFLSLAFPAARIDSAANGREAMRCFDANRPDVCVLDLHMPEMDGVQTFQAIEAQCKQQNRPMPAILFCTGYAPSNTVQSIIETYPRCRLLSKPVRMPKLAEQIRTLLT